MGMDQFVTTYRKDFLWPYVRTLGVKPEAERLYKPPSERGDSLLCECHCLKQPAPTSQQVLGPKATHEEAWSRLGPMGPLLDPKLYPAKVGKSPEVETSRFNQPNVFLQKLKQKYPYIYECLRNAPPDDLVSRINKDRLRSTYQVDFCNLTEYPSAPYDELIRAAGVEGMAPCPEPVKLPGDPCRPNQKPIAFKQRGVTKMAETRGGKGGSESGGGGGGGGGAGGSCGGGLPGVTPGSSEYQDGISKLGMMIIRDKIHHPPPPKGQGH